MDRIDANCALTNVGWWASHVNDFAAMGYIETQASINCALRHYLKLDEGGDYNVRIRYCNSNKAGEVKVTVNGREKTLKEGATLKQAIAGETYVDGSAFVKRREPGDKTQ